MTDTRMHRIIVAACGVGLLCTGCAHVVNHYVEDGPSTRMAWDSPTAQDIKAHHEPIADQRARDWEARDVRTESGVVYHWPLYFEDPFEDKGHGRTDATDPHNVYRQGWESWVAFPYGFARFTTNWVLLPVSAIVTPPWTVMESDGNVSQQLVWRDHDATREVSCEPTDDRPEPAVEN